MLNLNVEAQADDEIVQTFWAMPQGQREAIALLVEMRKLEELKRIADALCEMKDYGFPIDNAHNHTDGRVPFVVKKED